MNKQKARDLVQEIKYAGIYNAAILTGDLFNGKINLANNLSMYAGLRMGDAYSSNSKSSYIAAGTGIVAANLVDILSSENPDPKYILSKVAGNLAYTIASFFGGVWYKNTYTTEMDIGHVDVWVKSRSESDIKKIEKDVTSMYSGCFEPDIKSEPIKKLDDGSYKLNFSLVSYSNVLKNELFNLRRRFLLHHFTTKFSTSKIIKEKEVSMWMLD